MGTIHMVIPAFRQAQSNSERDTKFENAMVHYFKLGPPKAQEYDEVWRWIDYPDRDCQPHTSIDLVARSRDTRELTAIQCKFYEPEHPQRCQKPPTRKSRVHQWGASPSYLGVSAKQSYPC